MGIEEYSDAEIIAAIEEKRGMIFHAAVLLGCASRTIYRRAKASVEIQEAIDEARGTFVDDAESKLAIAVDAGEPWAIAMVLKGPGKDRGYHEKRETEHTGQTVQLVHRIVTKRADLTLPDEPPKAIPEQPLKAIPDVNGRNGKHSD